MSISKEKKQEIVNKFGKNPNNTGSTEVQIALITERINKLNEHFKLHKHDFHSNRGLLKLVGKRRALLNHLKDKNINSYRNLIAELNLRR